MLERKPLVRNVQTPTLLQFLPFIFYAYQYMTMLALEDVSSHFRLIRIVSNSVYSSSLSILFHRLCLVSVPCGGRLTPRVFIARSQINSRN